jgi:hypothetical protein
LTLSRASLKLRATALGGHSRPPSTADADADDADADAEEAGAENAEAEKAGAPAAAAGTTASSPRVIVAALKAVTAPSLVFFILSAFRRVCGLLQFCLAQGSDETVSSRQR